MQRRSQMMIIFLTVFIDLVGFGIIIPLSPYLATEYNATPFEVGLLMAIYSLMQFLFSPLWGKLSDQYGRRPILLMSLLGVGLSHIGFAFASSLTMLFVARMFGGIFAASISTAMAYIADITPPKERSKGMGLIGAAFGLGFILGPVLGGVFGHVGEQLGSAPPFGKNFSALIAAAICLMNFAFALKALPETLHLREMKSADRGSRWSLMFDYLSRPTVGILMLMFFLSTLGMAHMEATLFLYVKDLWGWSMAQASFGFAYVGVIMVLTQGYFVRKMLPKYGERKILMWGLVLCVLGMFGIANSHTVALMAVSVTLLGFGNGLVNPALSGSISLLTHEDEQGKALGVNQSLSALGRILGPAMGGFEYHQFGKSYPFAIAGFLMLLALALQLQIFNRIPNAAQKRD